MAGAWGSIGRSAVITSDATNANGADTTVTLEAGKRARSLFRQTDLGGRQLGVTPGLCTVRRRLRRIRRRCGALFRHAASEDHSEPIVFYG